MADPYPLYDWLNRFQRFYCNIEHYFPHIFIIAIFIALVSLILTFYRRFNRSNAELIERVMITVFFLIFIVFLARVMEIEFL